MPSNVDEPETGFADPRSFTATVAWMKAAATASRVDSGLVLAADSIGWIDGGPVLKPKDEADARRILRKLAGRRTRTLDRRCSVAAAGRSANRLARTALVAFAPLTDAEIDNYLATRIWQGCSGAYAIQEKDDPYVRVVRAASAT